MFHEPIHRCTAGLVRSRPSIHGIVAALNLEQMLRPTGSGESRSDGVGDVILSSLARIIRSGRGAMSSIDFPGACSEIASIELIVISFRHDGAIVA